MQKTYKLNLNMWALATDGNHILHKIDNVDYPVIRRTIVKAEDIDRWEELTAEEAAQWQALAVAAGGKQITFATTN